MAAESHPIEWLRPREREVLRLIAAGKTNPEIASELGITFETAKWHVGEVLHTLGVASREDAAREWRRYQRAPARLKRKLGATPILRRGVGATSAAAAIVVVAGLLVLLLLNDEDASALEPGIYIAYIREYGGVLDPDGPADQPALDVEEAPVQVVDIRSGRKFEVGEPRRYRAIYWSPTGEQIAALVLTENPGIFQVWLLNVDGGPDRPLGIAKSAPKFPLSDDLRRPHDASPELSWSSDGRYLAVATVDGVAIHDHERGVARPVAPLCPEAVNGNLAWAPDHPTLLQSCKTGLAVLEPPYAKPAITRFADFDITSHGTVVGSWTDGDTAVFVDSRGSGDRGYRLTVDGNARHIERIDGLDSETKDRALGYPTSDPAYADSVSEFDIDMAHGLVWSHYMPGASPDAWLGGYPGNGIWTAEGPEKLIVRTGGETVVIHVDATWEIAGTDAYDRPAGGRAQNGPVAHLLVIE